MFDIGMTELLVIGIVALIVVGPNDLPGMFRTLGRFTGKMRSMAREFQQAMNDAADETGVNEIGKGLKKDVKGLSNPKRYGLDKLSEAADKFEKWEPGKTVRAGRSETPLTEDRAAKAELIRETTARHATERLQAEAAAKETETETGAAAATPLDRSAEDRS